MAKETLVKLASQSLNEERDFKIGHAEKIIASQKIHGGDWQLVDKKFILKEDGSIEPASTGKAEDSVAKAADHKGDSA
ncbi:MAG: hypothetical protein WCG90_08245 [Chitinophagia bacterium]